MQREEPYLGLDILETFQRWIGAFGNLDTGAAWLSSARVVRCWLSPATDATFSLLASISDGNFKDTASDKLEEGRDDVKSSWYLPGLHTCYNGRYKGLLHSDVMLISKKSRS